MFNDVYIKDIYFSNKEKADKLILPEVRSLFLHIVGKFEDTPL